MWITKEEYLAAQEHYILELKNSRFHKRLIQSINTATLNNVSAVFNYSDIEVTLESNDRAQKEFNFLTLKLKLIGIIS